MVNHFASLLSNLDLLELTATITDYLVVDDTLGAISVGDDSDTSLGVDAYTTDLEVSRIASPLVASDFTVISLPPTLAAFHAVLFPSPTSLADSQFLLYCYLQLIAATDMSDDVYRYDRRITYDLRKGSDYLNRPFDFIAKLTELENRATVVDAMWAYQAEKCDISYEHRWRAHYNPVYRFAALLLGYVQRVQLLWQT